jgi:hypothetical protein
MEVLPADVHEHQVRRHEATPDELVSNRAELRQAIMRRLVFTNVTGQNLPAGAQRRLHLYALNVVEGEHFPGGTTAVAARDLNTSTLRLLLILMNAYTHATGGKGPVTTMPAERAPAKKGRKDDTAAAAIDVSIGPAVAHGHSRGYIVYENLRARADVTRLVGTRVWFCLYDPATRAPAPAAAASPPPPGTREDDPQAAAAGAQPPAPAPAPRPVPCPLSQGLIHSLREAAKITRLVDANAQKRAGGGAGGGRSKGRKRGFEEQAQPTMDTVVEPKNTLSYAYASCKTATEMVFEEAMDYFSPDRVGVSLPTEVHSVRDPAVAVVDTRPFFKASLGERNWDDVRQPHFYPYSDHLALRHIFSPAQAMVYHTQHVAAEQCDILRYFPHLAAAGGGEEEEEDDERLGDLMDLVERDGAGPLPVPASALRLDTWLRRWPALGTGADMPMPEWPFATTTYKLVSNATYPEVFSQLVLAHPLGLSADPLPSETLDRGLEETPFSNDSLYVRSAYLLREIEESDRHTTMSADQRATARFRRYDVSPSECARLSRAEISAALQREKRIVTVGLSRLESDAAACKYGPLLSDMQFEPSTSESLGTLDLMAGPDAERFRGHTQSTQERLAWEMRMNKKVREQFLADGASDKEVDALLAEVVSAVDPLDPDFLARDDTLQMRRDTQHEESALVVRYARAIASVFEANGGGDDDDVKATRLHALMSEYSPRFWTMKLDQATRFDDVFRTSDNMPDALCGPFRQWFAENGTAEALLKTLDAGGKQPPAQILAGERPFTQFLQFFHDTIRDMLHATSQSYAAAIVMFVCSLDAHFYLPMRSMPGTNLIVLGDTGIGKSFIMRGVMQMLCPPGVVRNISHATSQAFQTDTNLDGYVLAYEEFKTSWLFGTANDKDKGATQEINQLKMRMTSFFSETMAPHIDDATGRRTLVTSKASQHNVTVGASNQFIAGMDRNVERRFILYYMPRHVRAGEGSDAADLTNMQAFSSVHRNRMVLARHHQMRALFIYVSAMIKAGVLRDMDMSDADFQFGLVLKELGSNRFVSVQDGTRRHYVLQFARNLQLLFVSWLALYSPFAYAFHAQPGAPPRWSPAAILHLFTPFMRVSREALVYAATTLELLYAPAYVEQLLRVLVTKCIDLSAPVAEWPFYYELNPTLKTNVTWDVNYVMLEGATSRQLDICGYIARHNDEYLMRDADVEKCLVDLCGMHINATGYEAVGAPNSEGHPLAIQRRVGAAPRMINAMRFDTHPKHPRKCCLKISLEFLAQRLNIKLGDVEAVKRLRIEHRPHEPTEVLRPAFIEAYASVPRTVAEAARTQRMCSPMAASLASVLSTCLFEEDKELHPWLAREPTPRFITGYVVEPLTFYTAPPAPAAEQENAMDVDADVNANAAVRATRTVPLHGTHQMLELRRVASRPPMQQENFGRPLATARHAFAAMMTTGDPVGAAAALHHRRQPGATTALGKRAARFNSALGVISRDADMEAVFARTPMSEMCHPGFPFADALFYTPDSNTGVLPSDLPVLRPAILPYGFGPVLNRIFRRLAERDGGSSFTLRYPSANIEQRVQETLRIERDRQQGTTEAYVNFGDIMGVSTYGGLCFDLY